MAIVEPKAVGASTLRYTIIGCPLGSMLVAATDNGLRRVSLGGDDTSLLADLHRDHVDDAIRADPLGLADWADPVLHNLCGALPLIEVPIDIIATDFQRRVWLELRAIPYGDTRTYTDIARTMGRADSVRAVANACAANRLAVVIPCHRVLREDGSLGGFRWGFERKRALIEFERKQRGGAGIRDGGQTVLEF